MSKNNTIRCSVTGLEVGTMPKRKLALIEQYGSLEELEKNYVCRDAKRLRKEGKTDDEIKAMADAGEISSAVKSVSKKTKTKKTKVATDDSDPVAEKKPAKQVDEDVATFMAAGDATEQNEVEG